ncbi:hypothetical protein BaRGS_00004898 [Batillaria attramentaria]|uniref:PLAC domain-containing protein n=1 Tax=Batillaria attramentaria TaxID=370345 RepID=A0ABD0LX73_9CAEN
MTGSGNPATEQDAASRNRKVSERSTSALQVVAAKITTETFNGHSPFKPPSAPPPQRHHLAEDVTGDQPYLINTGDIPTPLSLPLSSPGPCTETIFRCGGPCQYVCVLAPQQGPAARDNMTCGPDSGTLFELTSGESEETESDRQSVRSLLCRLTDCSTKLNQAWPWCRRARLVACGSQLSSACSACHCGRKQSYTSNTRRYRGETQQLR